MFPSRLINDKSLLTSGDGFSFELRMPWYRALPVSSLAEIEITVDGVTVDLEDVSVTVGGRTDPFEDLAPRYEDWWYVLDPARVEVHYAGGLTEGEHRLSVTLGLRIPYIIVPTGVLVLRERCTKSLKDTAEVTA